MRSFNTATLSLFFLFFVSSSFSQDDLDPKSLSDSSKNKGNTKSTIEIKGGGSKPRINIDEVKREFEPPPKEIPIPRNLRAQHWPRFTGGLWLNYSNQGIARPLVKASQDKVLMNNSTERAWGFGGQLDFSAEGESDQAIRGRVGFMKSAVQAQSAINNQYPNASFENRVNIFHLSAIHRWRYLSAEDVGHLWFGWGGQMNYAFSSTRIRAASGSPRSKLNGSYAFNLLLAMGTDYPISDLEDICFEVQYLPSKAFAMFFGFRSSL